MEWESSTGQYRTGKFGLAAVECVLVVPLCGGVGVLVVEVCLGDVSLEGDSHLVEVLSSFVLRADFEISRLSRDSMPTQSHIS